MVKFTLNFMGIKEADISIAFMGDGRIRRLNHLYRGKDRATDVLAFPLGEGRRPKGGRPVSGDIAISVDRARKQAKRFGSTFKREIYLYIIHGLLHLGGYDDEKAHSERAMRRKETEILEGLWQKADL